MSHDDEARFDTSSPRCTRNLLHRRYEMAATRHEKLAHWMGFSHIFRPDNVNICIKLSEDNYPCEVIGCLSRDSTGLDTERGKYPVCHLQQAKGKATSGRDSFPELPGCSEWTLSLCSLLSLYLQGRGGNSSLSIEEHTSKVLRKC